MKSPKSFEKPVRWQGAPGRIEDHRRLAVKAGSSNVTRDLVSIATMRRGAEVFSRAGTSGALRHRSKKSAETVLTMMR